MDVEGYIGANVEVLEDILDKRAQEYAALGEYDHGSDLTPDRLRSLTREVMLYTKEFLGRDVPAAHISMFHLPRDIKRSAKIGLGIFTVATLAELADGLTMHDLWTAGTLGGLFGVGGLLTMYRDHLVSLFDDSEKVIRISEKKEVNAVGVIAHEYAHNLQSHAFNLKHHKNIIEGHARGMDRIISSRFAEMYGNRGYVHDFIDRTAKELKDAYLFIAKNPRESLARLPIPDIRNWLYNWIGHHYSMGVAAMSIAEAKLGDQVYRDVLDRDFSFLRY